MHSRSQWPSSLAPSSLERGCSIIPRGMSNLFQPEPSGCGVFLWAIGASIAVVLVAGFSSKCEADLRVIEQSNKEHKAAFFKQCRADDKSETDCAVLWSQVK